MNKRLDKSVVWAAFFAVLNIVMYYSVKRFWIGGSSFLPIFGKFGEGGKFIFASAVNMGVIIGAFLAAYNNEEFILRLPERSKILKAVAGGSLMGIGIALAPGTCTTAVVVGLPMLSISSFLSISGMFIGGFIVYTFVTKKMAGR